MLRIYSTTNIEADYIERSPRLGKHHPWSLQTDRRSCSTRQGVFVERTLQYSHTSKYKISADNECTSLRNPSPLLSTCSLSLVRVLALDVHIKCAGCLRLVIAVGALLPLYADVEFVGLVLRDTSLLRRLVLAPKLSASMPSDADAVHVGYVA